uniref:TSSK6 activating cochaperone n=1 Tax=Pelusios castaneus TaxID=367368 RepID=A0A8C8RIJ4_9SAUR
CPAKPSPSFLELPSSQRKPTLRKGKQTLLLFSPAPDHQPQECYGLLECMHNNIQIQTQIAQAQLSILESLKESMSLASKVTGSPSISPCFGGLPDLYVN